MTVSVLVLGVLLILFCQAYAQAIARAGTGDIMPALLKALGEAWSAHLWIYVWGLLVTVALWIGSACHVLVLKEVTDVNRK